MHDGCLETESSLPFKPLNWSHVYHIEGLKVKQE